MITIPIYIFDDSKKNKTNKLLEENEALGYEKNKIDSNDLHVKWNLTDYFLSEKDFGGFWVDPNIDDDSKTIDIIFDTNGHSFRTPYTEERYYQFLQLITDK